ncbi:ABC transporter ATP-binding protein [Occultella aeris]|uniref:Teichoic acids export ATP-binding protein TagH n=1 Tax=Occultella aeris TaxID=2761496 RepID=A0A7M4DL10_9MICO|nr:ABC transporter ATP-binding protein [Occultella aeris]VZO37900.1 Teichoic acids export ATP-binding protein TagH [Occultella aeris]
MTDIAIKVGHLSKTFRLQTERRNSIKEMFVRGKSRGVHDFHALRDVSFEVPRGSTFGLVGHNGSGKSTLLKILAGVYRPSAGQVLVDGRVSALLELGAGFHGELTGRENIYLNGAILGLSKKQIDRSMDQIIDFAGIGEFIDSPVKVYSSGMYVRLGFSVAVTLDPEILIVDEIIAVGDEEFQRKCFDHLFELRRRGTTIVLVTHSLTLAAELCDQGIWLDHGRPRALGDVSDVIDGYLLDVNAKESAARAEADAAAGGEPGDVGDEVAVPIPRQGSGEIRMTKVTLHDASGAEVGFVTPGEECTVRVHYRSTRSLEDVTFGLAFIHESGITVAGPNSMQDDRRYDIEPGEGFVDFYSEALPLQPGAFNISTAIVDKGHTYDYSDRETELRVRADHAVREPGLTRMLGRWSAEPSLPVEGKA